MTEKDIKALQDWIRLQTENNKSTTNAISGILKILKNMEKRVSKLEQQNF